MAINLASVAASRRQSSRRQSSRRQSSRRVCPEESPSTAGAISLVLNSTSSMAGGHSQSSTAPNVPAAPDSPLTPAASPPADDAHEEVNPDVGQPVAHGPQLGPIRSTGCHQGVRQHEYQAAERIARVAENVPQMAAHWRREGARLVRHEQ